MTSGAAQTGLANNNPPIEALEEEQEAGVMFAAGELIDCILTSSSG